MPQVTDHDTRVAARLDHVLGELRELERRYGRKPGSVSLVAVSKRHPPALIRAAYACGQRDFGENYLQEARAKQQELAGLDIAWHFIGAIQSNKTADIARHFDWVHTVDRERIARRLNEQRPDHLPPLNVLLQVNISNEDSKNGLAPDALPALAGTVTELPRLALRGLMALPAPVTDFDAQRAACRALAELACALDFATDCLSMGTTNDYPAAIAEGATHVRLGTAVFGPRPDPA